MGCCNVNTTDELVINYIINFLTARVPKLYRDIYMTKNFIYLSQVYITQFDASRREKKGLKSLLALKTTEARTVVLARGEKEPA